MAWFAIEEGGTVIGFAQGAPGKEPGGYDDPRFTLTKLSRKPGEDDEFVDGQLQKRAASARQVRTFEQRIATLEEQVAALMAAKPA